jgi:hypothetical protein
MNEKQQVSRAKALASLKELMEGAAYVECLALTARASFDKYRALIAAGFTEDQAVKIVAVSPY